MYHSQMCLTMDLWTAIPFFSDDVPIKPRAELANQQPDGQIWPEGSVSLGHTVFLKYLSHHLKIERVDQKFIDFQLPLKN